MGKIGVGPVKRTVYVYRRGYTGIRGEPRAFTLTYANPQTDGACVHEVEALSTREAKKLAAREHAERCGNQITHGVAPKEA